MDEIQVRKESVGPWSASITNRRESVRREQWEGLVHILPQWVEAFTLEDTLAQREFGVPSLFLRIDCSPQPSGSPAIYEVEERPSGFGLAIKVCGRLFEDRLETLLMEWPQFAVVVSPQRGIPGTDDFLWREVVDPQAFHGAVLIRAEPEEREFHCLAPRSVSSVKTKGDKSYGERLGWWRKVYESSCLPWEQGFCLKPLQSSKCRNLFIVPPQDLPGRKKLQPTTRSRVERALSEHGAMYVQEWIPPYEAKIQEHRYLCFWRIYFGFVVGKGWQAIGGYWLGRPGTLRLHGAQDAVFGPLVLED